MVPRIREAAVVHTPRRLPRRMFGERVTRRCHQGARTCPKVTRCRLDDKERIRAIRDGFAAEDVVIAEVGAWGNMMPPDEGKRAEKFRSVCVCLALADEVGALCCVDYLGTPVPGGNIDPPPNPRCHPGDRAEQRRFSGPVRPGYEKDLSLRQRESDVPDRRQASVADRHVGKRQKAHSITSSTGRSVSAAVPM